MGVNNRLTSLGSGSDTVFWKDALLLQRARLGGCFEAFADQRLTHHNSQAGLPDQVCVGDIYRCNFPPPEFIENDKEQEKRRDAVIWHVARDKDNHVQAVSFFLPTTKLGNYHCPGDLLVETERDMNLTGQDRSTRFQMSRLCTLPNTSVEGGGHFFRGTGCAGRIDPKVIPHLVALRVEAILWGRPEWRVFETEMRSDWLWDGHSFDSINPDYVRNGIAPPDIAGQVQFNAEGVPGGLSQKDIDGIVQWVSGKAAQCELIKWEGLGQPVADWAGYPRQAVKQNRVLTAV